MCFLMSDDHRSETKGVGELAVSKFIEKCRFNVVFHTTSSYVCS
jgi:hypothetical protein